MNATTIRRARDVPQTDPQTAMAHSQAEYAALLTMVDRFTEQDWARPTDCTGWTPREMLAHIAGAAAGAVRLRTLVKHYGIAAIRSRRNPLEFVDHLCASQIAERRLLRNDEIAADLRRWASRAPAKLAAVPRFARRIPIPAAAGLTKGSTVSTFVDVINTRDIWLHRVDLARATGQERVVTPAEPEVVRQVVRDLDTQWSGPALELTLVGPGGGTWLIGDGEPVARVTEDAVGYLRLLSGRSDECRLDTRGDPCAATALRAARVVF